MADKKITQLTAGVLTEVTDAALLAMVADPSGTPTTRKVALELLGVPPSSWLDYIRLHEADSAASGGSFTVGTEFCAVRSGQTCTGMRFRWGGAIARTVKCALWKKGAGIQKTADVSVTAAGIYTASWGAHSITRNETWIVSIWEKSGAEFMPQTSTLTRVMPRPTRLRNYVITNPSVYYATGGDGEPDTTGSTATAFSCFAEPIVTG
jgi:hypothetical protein